MTEPNQIPTSGMPDETDETMILSGEEAQTLVPEPDETVCFQAPRAFTLLKDITLLSPADPRVVSELLGR